MCEWFLRDKELTNIYRAFVYTEQWLMNYQSLVSSRNSCWLVFDLIQWMSVHLFRYQNHAKLSRSLYGNFDKSEINIRITQYTLAIQEQA